jgi:hypothetical protein
MSKVGCKWKQMERALQGNLTSKTKKSKESKKSKGMGVGKVTGESAGKHGSGGKKKSKSKCVEPTVEKAPVASPPTLQVSNIGVLRIQFKQMWGD